MLAKKYRLQVQKFPQKGISSRKVGHFLIKKTPNKESFSRFGVVISKKVDKRASNRNSLKRQVFEWIRVHGLYLVPGQDVLIIFLPEVSKMSPEKFRPELDNLLSLV